MTSTNAATALRFVRAFCAGRLDQIGDLVADELQFRGPLLQVSSRREFLDAVAADPPVATPHRILGVTENADGQVAIFWDYLKPDRTLRIAQLFTLSQARIAEIVLVFSDPQ